MQKYVLTGLLFTSLVAGPGLAMAKGDTGRSGGTVEATQSSASEVRSENAARLANIGTRPNFIRRNGWGYVPTIGNKVAFTGWSLNVLINRVGVSGNEAQVLAKRYLTIVDARKRGEEMNVEMSQLFRDVNNFISVATKNLKAKDVDAKGLIKLAKAQEKAQKEALKYFKEKLAGKKNVSQKLENKYNALVAKIAKRQKRIDQLSGKISAKHLASNANRFASLEKKQDSYEAKLAVVNAQKSELEVYAKDFTSRPEFSKLKFDSSKKVVLKMLEPVQDQIEELNEDVDSLTRRQNEVTSSLQMLTRSESMTRQVLRNSQNRIMTKQGELESKSQLVQKRHDMAQIDEESSVEKIQMSIIASNLSQASSTVKALRGQRAAIKKAIKAMEESQEGN